MNSKGFIAAAKRMPPLRAPYNFVRLNETVLTTPLENGPSHAVPVADHLSGEVEVEWAAETPLLVGGSDNNMPCRYGDDGPFVIPGASLRGLIRATLEIAAYARLSFVEDQRFGLRDFDSVTWKAAIGGNVNNIRAGWLKKNANNIELSELRYGRVAIDDLRQALRAGNVDVEEEDWQGAALRMRKAHLTTAGLGRRLQWIERTDIECKPFEKRIYRPAQSGETNTVDGYLVVAGAAHRPNEAGSSNKKYETVFFGHFDDGSKKVVPTAAMELFEKIQIEDGNQHEGQAETNWSCLKEEFEAGKAIPVFFCGVPDQSDFVLSLTRLMRVPFSHSVLDVAKRSQKAPGPRAALDFVQALFGYTPAKGIKADPQQPLTRAWKSRVFFRHAELSGNAPEPDPAVDMVTMQPSPSFYPYYLRPDDSGKATHPVDWSSEHARLAGRKRYPARNRAAGIGEVVRAPKDSNRAKQESHPRFLPATPQKPLVFKSRIRLHNVGPIELGGLIFALTFGQLDQDQGYRHMLGRAKAYGFGQIKTRISEMRLSRADGKAGPSAADCVRDFKKWVIEQPTLAGQAYEELPEIADLLGFAHAETGAELHEHLRFPSVDGEPTDAEAVLNAYQRIKKSTSTEKGKKFTQSGRKYPGFAGATASEQPDDGQGFWFLPRYAKPR